MPKAINIRSVIESNPLAPGNGWNPIEYPVNFCLLGGEKSPGLFLIDKGSFKARWQRAPQPGRSGEALRYLGEAAVEFTGTVYLFSPAHWAHWDQWIPIFDRPKRGTEPKALSWWHPLTQCRARPVRSVIVEEYEIPKHLGGAQWASAIQFVEYWRPKMAASKPEPAATEAPKDAAEQQMRENSEAIKRRREVLEAAGKRR